MDENAKPRNTEIPFPNYVGDLRQEATDNVIRYYEGSAHVLTCEKG
jgi:hypothetical protein